MPKKYKPVSECPTLLEKIIELVNILPSDAEELFNKICEGRNIVVGENGAIIRDSAKEILDEKIVEFCFDREAKTNYFERFGDLMKAKILLRHFAGLNKKFPSWKEVQKDNFEKYRFQLHFASINYQDRQFPTMLGFTWDGFIKPAKSEFLDMFEDSDIPVYRIRECSSCFKIYWAKKTNSQTCGEKKCVNQLGNKTRAAKAKTQKEKLNNHFQSRVKNNGTL